MTLELSDALPTYPENHFIRPALAPTRCYATCDPTGVRKHLHNPRCHVWLDFAYRISAPRTAPIIRSAKRTLPAVVAKNRSVNDRNANM